MYPIFHPKVLILLLAALVSVACISIRRFLARRQFAHKHGCKPVARSFGKDPFLGLDTIRETIRALRQHKILERSVELFRIYGNTFTIKELQKRAILTIEPENIKTILSLNFNDYGISHRLQPFKPLLGEGIFDTDGAHWASSRALIRPSFTRDQVADLTALEDLMQDLFALLPRDGKTVVDLKELFFRYTIDSATEFLFGQSVGTLKKTQSELGFAHAFHYAQKAIITRGMLGPLAIFYRDRKADECNRVCRELVQRFVDEAFQAVETRRDDKAEEEQAETKRPKRIFSHELAARTSDKRRVLDELMNVLLAGRDTTASLLGNLFFMLAKKPEIWDKLRAEVACLQGRAPTYEELRNLRYVHCCINECKRALYNLVRC
jgi:cytochrome P450